MSVGDASDPYFDRLIGLARESGPVAVALAHPCDTHALESALDANRLGLIKPILVGPRARIEQAAADAALDISALPVVNTPHSHASAARAVEIVREGGAQALMERQPAHR